MGRAVFAYIAASLSLLLHLLVLVLHVVNELSRPY